MMSGRVVAWKYFLLGCSLALCSLEYCSILFKRYDRRPNSSLAFSKNSPDCFPISSIHMGGRPSISVMRDTWLYSDDPGKSGNPKKSSTTMQPRDHMSIAEEYLVYCQSQCDLVAILSLTVDQAGLQETDRIVTGCTYRLFASHRKLNRSQ
jgi:hypothetical protein